MHLAKLLSYFNQISELLPVVNSFSCQAVGAIHNEVGRLVYQAVHFMTGTEENIAALCSVFDLNTVTMPKIWRVMAGYNVMFYLPFFLGENYDIHRTLIICGWIWKFSAIAFVISGWSRISKYNHWGLIMLHLFPDFINLNWSLTVPYEMYSTPTHSPSLWFEFFFLW